MAEAVAAPRLHRDLPDEISIWEILTRLPPKALLRCHAVCRAWRRAISTHRFLLAHHARQPLDIIPFDHRAGLTAADQLRSVARLGGPFFVVDASCDGLLLLSINARPFAVCNPATRQYAPLPMLFGFKFLGMYPHDGDYRLLLNTGSQYDGPATQDGDYHIFTLGSCQPPRHIRCPNVERLSCLIVSVMLHGSLHWYTRHMIMVFDTTAELFRQMRSPICSGNAHLFEIGGMLGMYSANDGAAIMDIWVMHDYKGEVWVLKHRVELPLAEFGVQLENNWKHWSVVVPSWDGDLLVLVQFGGWVFQVDMDGKLAASFHHRHLLLPSQHGLKQSLVQHAFFLTLEGYVVSSPSSLLLHMKL